MVYDIYIAGNVCANSRLGIPQFKYNDGANKMGFKRLYTGFETCFGWDPQHLYQHLKVLDETCFGWDPQHLKVLGSDSKDTSQIQIV